ncbi:hypothetical protein EIP86_007358 [Pleurotus ostreatoroseus]|nr:hypothetical protein EIP86_007358 [Pleurotus ostreatoroseus]
MASSRIYLILKWVDLMITHGQIGIDTARVYSERTAERFLTQLNLKGMRIDTKIYPVNPGDHKADKLKATFKHSLEALGQNKIRVFYLHIPDRSVPFEETLEAVNDLYKAGHFEEFGLSNYMAFEVAEIVGICERRGFVKPTVYEGVYNILDRNNEAEGGFLTGKLLSSTYVAEAGSHFDPKYVQTWFYRERYMSCVAALRELNDLAGKHGLRLAEVAYRWLQHHSALVPEDHGVILGATRAEQLERPLPQEVVDKCEETWKKVKGNAKQYWL